mmetsp:Transcript_27095/g.79783  ORF Transcript_27095/g.79783 Transcript_27095/m.79783 type:complete len:212 (-) Transcript_27095:944-1579(-)
MHMNMKHVHVHAHVHVLHVHVGIWLPRARPPPRNLALSTCDTPPPNARQCTIHSHLPPHAATHRSSTRSFSAAKARASPRWREGASVGEPFANPAPAASRRLSRRCFQTRAAAAPTARRARSSPAGEEGEAPSSARSASARKRSRASCIARGPPPSAVRLTAAVLSVSGTRAWLSLRSRSFGYGSASPRASRKDCWSTRKESCGLPASTKP